MTTFNYSSKSSIKDNLTEILIGAALIIIPIVYPFGISRYTPHPRAAAYSDHPCPCRTVYAVQSLAEDT